MTYLSTNCVWIKCMSHHVLAPLLTHGCPYSSTTPSIPLAITLHFSLAATLTNIHGGQSWRFSGDQPASASRPNPRIDTIPARVPKVASKAFTSSRMVCSTSLRSAKTRRRCTYDTRSVASSLTLRRFERNARESRLLQLPAEIRMMIWTYVLEGQHIRVLTWARSVGGQHI